MGYINRFLLFLYALAVALAALGVIVLCLPIFPVSATLNETSYLLSRWETILGAVLVFLISVHLVACSLTCGSGSGDKKNKKEPEAVVVHGASGEVRIAVSAVSSLAAKCASKIHGVESVDAKVESSRAVGPDNTPSSKVVIKLDVNLGGGQNVAQVSDAIRTSVSEQMNDVLGLTDCTVDISVAEIGSQDAAKPRVS